MRTAVLKALATVAIWGCSFLAIRVALEGATPWGVVWMRSTLAAVLLFALLGLRGQPLLPERGDRARCVVLGLIGATHFLIQTLSMQSTTTLRAGWIIAFIPVVVALGSRLFLRQRLAALGWVGITLATSGVLVLTSVRPAELASAGAGDALMLVSTVTWASYTLLALGPISRNGGLRVTALALGVSVVPTLAVALFQGSWHAAPSLRPVLALVFLGACASALAMWLFADAVGTLGPERTSAFQYLQPFVTLGVSFVFLDEPFTAATLVGGPLVLAGVALVQRSKRAPVPNPGLAAPATVPERP